ncbi:MAG: ABC transporter permease [Phaeodactylibacter sp.]|nr:ABC transporter permease [Phaeodactylibacter sp.]MCB9276626.1 ABC transporter permease [Lewinellaceae bacterium]
MNRVIENRPRSLKIELQEVWRALPIAWMLARREWKAKYAHTAMGLVWAVVPLAAYVLIYTLFFSVLLKVETEIPYPLVALSGLVGWNYFKDIIYNAAPSIANEGQFLKRNFLPKLVIPLYKSMLGLVELGVSMLLLFLLLGIFRSPLSAKAFLLPLVVALNFLTGFTIAVWVCSLSGRRRDFFHLAASALNVAIWLTPVFYLPSLIPATFRPLLYINPMATIVGAYRWILLGTQAPPLWGWVSVIIFLGLLLAGLRVFFNRQHLLVDFA